MPDGAPGGTATILIVDDDPGIATMLQIFLSGHGFRPVTVHSGPEALGVLACHAVDLILLDLMMPGMDGYAVCRAVKEAPRFRSIPVVMLTAKDAVRDKVRGLESGADDYITKPFNSEELIARVRVLLRLRQVAEEVRRRSERLAALNTMAAELAAALNHSSILGIVTDQARTPLGAEVAILCLPDASGDVLPRAWSGTAEAWTVRSQARIEEARADGGAFEWHPVAAPEAERACAAAVQEAFRASWLAVPLGRGSAAFGALGVGHRAPGQFQAGDGDLLAALGNQAAVAMENARLFAQVRRLATVDDLTGLSNRRHFFGQLGQELRRTQRYGRPMSLVMLDIDRFKPYNDRYGHLAGDRVLREVAEVLRRNSREVDVVARYGGDEFSLILPETDAGAGATQADRIRGAVAHHAFPGEERGEVVAMTVSLGVASLTAAMHKPEDLIRAADEALYRAKAGGRNRLVVDGEAG